MITLADQPLLLQDPGGKLQDWMAYQETIDSMRLWGSVPKAVNSTQFARDKSGVTLPKPNFPDCLQPKLNTLYWPSGAMRWAYGLFLADTDTKDKITAVAFDSTNGANDIDLVMGDSTNDNTIAAKVYLLPPRPVTAFTDPQGGKQLWLLPVVDQRYWWQFISVGVNCCQEKTDWNQLMEWIVCPLKQFSGKDVTIDSVPSEYLKPDVKEFSRDWMNTAQMLDAAVQSCSMRLVCSLQGNVTIQTAETAETYYAQNSPFTLKDYSPSAGGRFDTEGITGPEKVVVSFHKYSDGMAWSDKSDSYTEQFLPTDIAGTFAKKTALTINSGCLADYSGGVTTPANTTKLHDLATKIGSDFYAWQQKRFDVTNNGLRRWVPTGFDDFVEWSYARQVDDGRYVARTRIHSLNMDYGSEWQLSQDPSLVRVSGFQLGVATSSTHFDIYDTTPGSEATIGLNVRAYPWPSTTSVTVGNSYRLLWHEEENVWYWSLAGTPTTTTTTTTQPPSESSCTGQCKWFWYAAANIWEIAENGCANTTTTTSTTSSTSTSSTSTSSTTTQPCDCGNFTSTTSTSSTTTSTTTSTTPYPCQCAYPAFCGSVNGECTYTYCVQGNVQPDIPCTTPNPCNCSTTTTTTLPPGCVDCCDWIWRTGIGWIKTEDRCPAECPCSPPRHDGADCSEESTGGGAGGGGGGSGACLDCNGFCRYVWVPSKQIWRFAGAQCTGTEDDGLGCFCTPPSVPAADVLTDEDCFFIDTTCNRRSDNNNPCNGADQPCKKCYTTTTTTTVSPCGGGCKWKGDGAGGWTIIEDNCSGSCPCQAPLEASVASCEAKMTVCNLTTTTTTSTTTTTTTTSSTTTTTTTTSSTTTTTPPPGCSGNCFYQPDPANPGSTTWVLAPGGDACIGAACTPCAATAAVGELDLSTFPASKACST